jgi:adenylate cyclase
MKYALTCYGKALTMATAAHLSHKTASFTEDVRRYQKAEVTNVTDHPMFGRLRTYEGMRAYGAVLSFDLRGSSALADALSPRAVFTLMHTFIPTMLYLATEAGGIALGLRGDGAIVMFGVKEFPEDRPDEVERADRTRAVRQAAKAGYAMVTMMRNRLGRVLRDLLELSEPPEIGVGIDQGGFVVTDIGYQSARELTAYGSCVNYACKRAKLGRNRVVLTGRARAVFPKGESGKAKLSRHPTKGDAHFLDYPISYSPFPE